MKNIGNQKNFDLRNGAYPVKSFRLLVFIPFMLLAACHHSSCHGDRIRNHQVTAYGYGALKVVPDVADWTVEVEFTRPEMAAAMTETQKVMDAVLAACSKAIPDSNDIKTARVYTRKEFVWENNANVFKGYTASQSVEIKLRDFSKMESLSEEILKLQISSMNGPEFSHSKSDSLRSEANALAMKDAEKNAQRMCQAVNVTCENLISAKIVNPMDQSIRPVSEGVSQFAMKSAPVPNGGVSVKPGILTFTSSVEATYGGR